jgi:hypothetical protein
MHSVASGPPTDHVQSGHTNVGFEAATGVIGFASRRNACESVRMVQFRQARDRDGAVDSQTG